MVKIASAFFFLWSTLLCYSSIAQSPYLSVKFIMDSTKLISSQYKIEMKICQLKNPSERKDWFSYDVSKVKFDTVSASNIACAEFIENGEGVEVISGEPVGKRFNEYSFSNQLFAWENILVFKITNESSRANLSPMFVVLPIRYKAFVTHVIVKNVPFEPGKFVYVESETVSKEDTGVKIESSLKDVKGVVRKDFKMKGIL